MPLYHFNISNSEYQPDEEGTELADADEARVQAVIFAGAYLRDNPDLVWEGHRFRVEVTDDAGQVLFEIVVNTEEKP